ncbi:MAG: NAD(P)/FAD-dependent oxidoreductase [Methanomicrobiales archaeon]|nr:NAD(P)/FAD-dependent oxidoreductase [Methanomicrobiales archaeon]
MIAVIGGGPAGRYAAMRLARAGKEVCLAEKNRLGGQCLHYGCMVVCALNDIARMVRHAESLHRMDILDDVCEIRFPQLMRSLGQVQAQIQGVLEEETRQSGVKIMYETEGMVEGREVFLNDEAVETEGAIIATGSHPNIPEISGLERGLAFTPHTLSMMRSVPAHLGIIGGGVMAAEFAYIFSVFGSDVTIFARSTFLRDADPFIRKMAQKELEAVRILEGAKVSGANGEGGSIALEFEQDGRPSTMDFDALLIASGLRPSSECARGIEKGRMGEIVVDDRMRTRVAGVYAAGDVTGPPYLTPVARMEGIIAAENLLGNDRRMDYTLIPRSISLANDIAYCDTGSKSGTIANVSAPAPAGSGSFWHVPERYTGAGRLTLDPSTKRILGFALVAPGGSLVASYMNEFIRLGFSVEDLQGLMEVHPSTDGLIPLIRYASEHFKKNRNGKA